MNRLFTISQRLILSCFFPHVYNVYLCCLLLLLYYIIKYYLYVHSFFNKFSMDMNKKALVKSVKNFILICSYN